MKKFSQYLIPEKKSDDKKPKTIVDEAWSNAKQKFEKEQPIAEQEDLKKNLFEIGRAHV